MSTLKFAKNDVLALLSTLKKDSKIMLVGDQGVYLMSFDSVVPRKIVYAEGCNPDIDSEWYETKDSVFGGDDGGDEIGTVESLLRIANVCSKWVVVKLTATQICIQSDVKVVIGKPKVDTSALPTSLLKYVK